MNLFRSPYQASDKNQKGQSQSGQIIVEYVLLLVVAVAVAVLLISRLISRNPDSPGILTQKWQDMIEFIGQDKTDDISRGG